MTKTEQLERLRAQIKEHRDEGRHDRAAELSKKASEGERRFIGSTRHKVLTLSAALGLEGEGKLGGGGLV